MSFKKIYNTPRATDDRKKYMREYMRKYYENKMLEKNGGSGIPEYVYSKRDFPTYCRCENFNQIWAMCYKQVLTYWDNVQK